MATISANKKKVKGVNMPDGYKAIDSEGLKGRMRVCLSINILMVVNHGQD